MNCLGGTWTLEKQGRKKRGKCLPSKFAEKFAGNFPKVLWTKIKKSPQIRSAESRAENGPYPQYGWDFPEEIPERPRNALRAFPGIPLESTAGIPQALKFKAFEGSRAFPEFSPPQVQLRTPLFSEVVPERASQSRSWNSQQYWGCFWPTTAFLNPKSIRGGLAPANSRKFCVGNWVILTLAPLQTCVGDYCYILKSRGFCRGFSWRIFLGTFPT